MFRNRNRYFPSSIFNLKLEKLFKCVLRVFKSVVNILWDFQVSSNIIFRLKLNNEN